MRRDEFSELPELVQRYLMYIEAIKGHSELSVIEYASDLRTFFRYIAVEKGLVPKNTQNEEIDLSPINIDFIKKGAVLHEVKKTKAIEDLAVDGVFPYIGFTPNVKDFSGQVMQDERGFIKVDEQMRTSTMGVFAAGDVRITPLRQVITAVSDGAVAGISAVKYIEELKLAAVQAK